MSSQEPPRAPIKRVPRQERSRVLVDSLLQATRQILEREGPDALNTNRIAEVAGVSIGSLYRYFDDKEAIVQAIFDADQRDALAQRVDWAREAMRLPLEDMLRLFVGRIAREHRRSLALHAALYREHHAHTDVRLLSDRARPPERGTPHVVEAFLLHWFERHPDEVRPVNLVHAAFLADRAGYAIIRDTVTERPEYLQDDAFIEEMVQVLLRYLRP